MSDRLVQFPRRFFQELGTWCEDGAMMLSKGFMKRIMKRSCMSLEYKVANFCLARAKRLVVALSLRHGLPMSGRHNSRSHVLVDPPDSSRVRYLRLVEDFERDR